MAVEVEGADMEVVVEVGAEVEADTAARTTLPWAVDVAGSRVCDQELDSQGLNFLDMTHFAFVFLPDTSTLPFVSVFSMGGLVDFFYIGWHGLRHAY